MLRTGLMGPLFEGRGRVAQTRPERPSVADSCWSQSSCPQEEIRQDLASDTEGLEVWPFWDSGRGEDGEAGR